MNNFGSWSVFVLPWAGSSSSRMGCRS